MTGFYPYVLMLENDPDDRYFTNATGNGLNATWLAVILWKHSGRK